MRKMLRSDMADVASDESLSYVSDTDSDAPAYTQSSSPSMSEEPMTEVWLYEQPFCFP